MNAELRKAPAKETLPQDVADAVEVALRFYWRKQLEAFLTDGPKPDLTHCSRWSATIDRWFYGVDWPAEEMAETPEAEDEAGSDGLVNTPDE